MKAGEFARKLKSAINDAGYTSNNVNIIDIVCINSIHQEGPCFKVILMGNDDRIFETYIEE